jgi:type IV secretion system protein VirD4
MPLVRLLLLSSVLLAAYSAALLVYLFPWFWVVGLGAAYAAVTKRRAADSHGSARWATAKDLPENEGMLIGLMETRSSLWLGIVALFHPRVSSAVACDAFLSGLRRPRSELVRVPATHAAIYSPTGGGKGVSFVIPHLLTCPDSCVVLDPKGENALETADHRAKEFGHKIVIVDPFKVVTK